MMVTFISQCEKKALARTRRVLDAFADRIGDNTWRTVITQDGLDTVRKLLRKTATKNTAVACHWARSRSRSELVWIVGNRQRFNHQGLVPVNSTQKDMLHAEWENDWHYLPVIKALVAVAALLHDWGKATALFQAKLLANSKGGDPLRHEWVSCLLLNALVRSNGNTDAGWLTAVANGSLDEAALIAQVQADVECPLANLPPLAQLVGWLILTHHRLPQLQKECRKRKAGDQREDMAQLLGEIAAAWSYANQADEARQQRNLQFPHGLLISSKPWLQPLQKWSARLLAAEAAVAELLASGAYRPVLHHARLCLMLGDHYYSSQPALADWRGQTQLYANTDHTQSLKQKLDEHLVNVGAQALLVSQSLSRLTTQMAAAYDIKALKKKSPAPYEWQDKAVAVIADYRQSQADAANTGWFVVNMASTGCGKTVANAKIMRALSDDGDSLRFILALGLRTLTLQTGDEYRERIGLKNDELAVLIGSAAVQELHDSARRQRDDTPSYEDEGSASQETLLAEELEFADAPKPEFLGVLFPPHKPKVAAKHQAFLYLPVLACTLDHIIAATETTRGGKYILPSLRLLSSDLVLDEVDDFDGKDLIAIARLIHLAGMLGRKVMISSATIPPAVAEGLFNAYQEGWRLHAAFKRLPARIACGWVDEFGSQVVDADLTNPQNHYQRSHQAFVAKRVAKLVKQVVKRRAYLLRLPDAIVGKGNRQSQQDGYFAAIRAAALELHQQHHTLDAVTGKRVSFGVVRVANIQPCVALTRYLLEADWPEEVAPRMMAYHSRQVLLLRHGQEQHLDAVLKRKEGDGETPKAFTNPTIRCHLDNTAASDVLFILVATPVEEVGRDHDFDWAIVEPSSFRSIIQLAGRVRRHRTHGVEQPNVAILQYNLRALIQLGKLKSVHPRDWRSRGGPVFTRPGYETSAPNQRLITPDLCQLVDEQSLRQAITAAPRILQPVTLRPTQQLADLEHSVLAGHLTHYQGAGPAALQGWLRECWWLTALPQQLNPFREGSEETNLYRLWRDDDVEWCERTERDIYIACAARANIKPAPPLSAKAQARLWLQRDFTNALRQRLAENDKEPDDAAMYHESIRFGEITFPKPLSGKDAGMPDTKGFYYADQFGLYPRSD